MLFRSLEGIEYLSLVDDLLIQGSTFEELCNNFRKLLDRCRETGIILSKKKLQYGTEVLFGGHRVSHEGVKPSNDRIKAIESIQPPTNVSEVRQFLGLVNQLASFLPNLSQMTSPINELLRKNTAFNWTDTQQKAFEECKSTLTGPLILRNFDPHLSVELHCDASRQSVGFCLLQRDKAQKPRLLTCGSRTLTPAEKNWEVISLELLAIV